ncbi:hypothetical protein K1719_027013 [Acacia pycnantha]|nr:hypothetical protein K1719_027013 [Acacia pycnantha]
MAAKEKSAVLVPRSPEEDDLLVRSSKKSKNGERGVPSSPLNEVWPKLGDPTATYAKGGPSFADTLKGKNRDEDSSDDEGGVEADPGSDDTMSDAEQAPEDSEPLFRIVEDKNRKFPKFEFSSKFKQRLYKAWRKSVIVKLLGRSIGYKALLTRLQSMWAKKGVVRLIDIGHGFYVVKMINKQDYQNALTGGPWMIYDHYLTVRPWEPNFHLDRAKINKVAVWVRVSKVVLEFYDRELCPNRKKDQPRSEGNYVDVSTGKVSDGGLCRNQESGDERDHWKTVQKVRRPRKAKEVKEGPLYQQASGSRFDVLAATEKEAHHVSVSTLVRDSTAQVVETHNGPLQSNSGVRFHKKTIKGQSNLDIPVRAEQKEQHVSKEKQTTEPRKRVDKRARVNRTGNPSSIRAQTDAPIRQNILLDPGDQEALLVGSNLLDPDPIESTPIEEDPVGEDLADPSMVPETQFSSEP